MSNDEPRNHSVAAYVSNLTEKEAQDLEQAFVGEKRKIAPEGIGNSAVGETKSFSGAKRKEIKGE
jgi:hypothetical protein